MADQRCNAHGVYSGDWCQLCGPSSSMIAVDPYDTIKALESKLEASEKEVARLRNQSDPLSDAAVSDYDELLAERDSLALRLEEAKRTIAHLDAESDKWVTECGLAEKERDALQSRLNSAVEIMKELGWATEEVGTLAYDAQKWLRGAGYEWDDFEGAVEKQEIES